MLLSFWKCFTNRRIMTQISFIAQKKIKTGDLLCPHEVCHAKNIMKDIEEKMDMAVEVDDKDLRIHDRIDNNDQASNPPTQDLIK